MIRLIFSEMFQQIDVLGPPRRQEIAKINKKQNQQFKQAGRRLNYVECGLPEKYPDQVSQCRDARIQSIPTWTRPGSTRLEGVQSINTLEHWSTENP